MLSLLALIAVIALVFIAWEVFDFTIKKVLGYSKATTTENHS